jgi:hypothetical protein
LYTHVVDGERRIRIGSSPASGQEEEISVGRPDDCRSQCLDRRTRHIVAAAILLVDRVPLGKHGQPDIPHRVHAPSVRGQAVDLDVAADVVDQQHVLVPGPRGLHAPVGDEPPRWRDRRSPDEELVDDQLRYQIHDRREFGGNHHQPLGRPWDDHIRRPPGGGNLDA